MLRSLGDDPPTGNLCQSITKGAQNRFGNWGRETEALRKSSRHLLFWIGHNAPKVQMISYRRKPPSARARISSLGPERTSKVDERCSAWSEDGGEANHRSNRLGGFSG